MQKIEIDDVRTMQQLRNPTFSKYQRAAVRKELLGNLQRGKIEGCCYWSAELVCSGLLMELWEIILYHAAKHIHTGNPKLPIYLNMRFQSFKEIINAGYRDNELAVRNNERIRKMFSEIMCVMCLSQTKHAFETVKVNKEDFEIFTMNDKLKAPTVEYIQDVFLSGDPKEIFIPLNELAYSLSPKGQNSMMACYWIEWIIEFENLCKKKKEKCEGIYRTFPKVIEKYQKDVIWIVWDIIRNRSLALCPTTKKIVQALLDLFCIGFTPSIKKKRRYIIYYAISLCCEKCSMNIEISSNKILIEHVVNKCHIIYKDLKKNEEAPKTDYLFLDKKGEKTNSEKTMERLDKLEKLESWNTVITDISEP